MDALQVNAFLGRALSLMPHAVFYRCRGRTYAAQRGADGSWTVRELTEDGIGSPFAVDAGALGCSCGAEDCAHRSVIKYGSDETFAPWPRGATPGTRRKSVRPRLTQ